MHIKYTYYNTIIGNVGTGKTLSIRHFLYDIKEYTKTTIGVDILVGYQKINNINIKDIYYDLSGNTRFKYIYNCFIYIFTRFL